MGSRGVSSMSSVAKSAKPKSKAQAIAEQIDEGLTKEYLEVVNNNDYYHAYTPEEAVQNLIDIVIPSSYLEQNIKDAKKRASAAKRTLNTARTSAQAKDMARIKLKSAQDELVLNNFNLAAAKILGW